MFIRLFSCNPSKHEDDILYIMIAYARPTAHQRTRGIGLSHLKKIKNKDSTADSKEQGHSNQDISELMERICSLEEEIKGLQKDNKDLQNENKGLQKEKKGLEDRNKDLEIENEVFKKALETKGIKISELLEEIAELKRRVNMNSSNSSKPPSTDGFKKPRTRSLRKRSGRRPGGQPGHKGNNMTIHHEPDSIVLHHPSECNGCPNRDHCSESMFSVKESRYVVDIEMRANVTEHRILCAKGCPKHEKYIVGSFPENVSAHVQYGDSVSTLANILSTFGAVSDSRISTIMRNLFDITISPGTIVSMVSRCANKVRDRLGAIKNEIISSEVTHFDETGIRINGKTLWVHNSSTNKYTYLTVSDKRGRIGMDENGILPKFKGIAIHDCWSSYWKYDLLHGLCNAHILRELKGIVDNRPEHQWPKLLCELLHDMKSAKDDAVGNDYDTVPLNILDSFDNRFHCIMEIAERECPPPPDPQVRRRGRRKVGKERALIERISANWVSMKRFVHDMRVPFDNNQAERDIRNVKIKVKVSGCFRSLQGAKNYLDITSYLSTAKKHGINEVKALNALSSGQSNIIFSDPSE